MMPIISLLQTILQTPHKFDLILKQHAKDQVEMGHANDEWAFDDVLNHITHSESLFLQRFKQIVAEDIPRLEPFTADQEPVHPQTNCTPEELNQQFQQKRWETIQYLKQLPPETWLREAYHPDYGQASLHFHVQNMFAHDREHINQMQKIADHQQEASIQLTP